MTEGRGGRVKKEIREDRKADQMNEEVGRRINESGEQSSFPPPIVTFSLRDSRDLLPD